MKREKFVSLLITVALLLFFLPTSFPKHAKAKEKNPLTIEKVYGLSTLSGTFRKAQGIAVAKDGTIFIADTGESQIEVYDSKYKYLRSFGSIGTGDGQFQKINQISFDQDENLYVLDYYLCKIQVFTKEGKLLRKIGGKETQSTQLSSPYDFTFLKTGELLVIETDNHSKLFSKDGKFLREFITDKRYQSDKWYPDTVTTDKYGSVYIAMFNYDDGEYSYIKFNPDGSFACEFVKWGVSEKYVTDVIAYMSADDDFFYLYDKTILKKYKIQKDPKEPLEFVETFLEVQEKPADSTIQNPSALKCHNQKLYLLDSSWNRLVVLSATKTVLGTIQSPILENGYMYPIGGIPKEILSRPRGIVIGPDNNFYVANGLLNRVSIFSQNWEEIGFVGKSVENQNKEIGNLGSPIDIAFDKLGNLYVTDLEPEQESVEIYTKDLSPFYSIPFNNESPRGITLDSFGNLVVVNDYNGLDLYDISKIADKKVSKKKSYPVDGMGLLDLVIDQDDNMIVSLFYSNEVVWINPKGKVFKTVGDRNDFRNPLYLPRGLCLDGAGNIYVSEVADGRIKKYSSKGELIWTSELLWSGLSFIAMDAQGKLFVTDMDHNVVLQINDSTAIPPVPFVPKPVQTKAAFSLSPSVESIVVGDSFTVQVDVKKLESCSNMTLSIRYPEDLISFKSCELGDLFKGTDFSLSEPILKPGVVTVTFDSSSKTEINKSGSLLTLAFQAKKAGTGKLILETIAIKNANDREILFGTKTDLDITILSSDTTPPILKVKPILEVVYDASIVLQGSTEPDATVTINQKEVPVKPDGTFETTLELVDGENTILVIATDKAGNHSDVSLKVVRKEKIIIKLVVGSKEIFIKGVLGILDSEPFIDKFSGRTMVPLRAIAEAIGATVSFQAKEQRIDILKDAVLIQLWIGKPKALVNGLEVEIDSQRLSPMIVKGRTFLPLRFVAETFAFQVDWDPKTQGITLTYPKG